MGSDDRTNLPNIVIFNPDQWRGDVLGHLGNPAAVTPNLDAFVGEGGAVSFSHAFCTNPVCTPSRCSFMTGWYPHVRGHRTMYHMLHPERGEPNLLKVLREHGYYVWWGGKNDLVPGQFDYEEHADEMFWPSAEQLKRWDMGASKWPEWRGEPDADSFYSFYVGKIEQKGGQYAFHNDWVNVLGACDFIRAYDGDQPFCVYLPLTYPHPPYAVEDPWYSAIERDKVPDHVPTPTDWSTKPAILQGIHERQNLHAWTEDRWRELRATYYGMCARVDHQFGLVLDALRESQCYDQTGVFFFADHGDFTGDYGLVEKNQNTFEDCLTRVPLLVKLPVSQPARPRVTNALVELVDFPATVYDLLAINPGYWHFGKSLLPVIAGDIEEHRDAVFCEGGRLAGETAAKELESKSSVNPKGEYWPRISLQISDDGPPYHTKGTMCRTRVAKYVRRLYEEDEFYDLTTDPGEQDNRIHDPTHAASIAQLKERMLTWYQETCDVVPFDVDQRGF